MGLQLFARWESRTPVFKILVRALDSTPLTGNLLGDDLEKQIKTQDEMRKVGFDLSAMRNKDHTVVKY